ncbi:MAG: DUF1254 domain-containing protein [Gammaproteobacteria bacterium]|nr:DUF1254 domain-containing protein [Gammaproteobacteria bacterium]
MKKLAMRFRIASGIAVALLVCGGSSVAQTAAPAASQPAPAAAAPAPDWRETYGYTLGMQAFVVGFPWVLLPEIRYKWVTVDTGSPMVPYAPLNQFFHARKLTTAEYRDGGSPNNDTLYSIAWLDLSKGPVILSHPAMGERYFTFEMASLDSDNFAYVGTRTTGSKAGRFAVIGPNWHGTLPAGVVALDRARTNSVLMLGRTLVKDSTDAAAVNKIQDQYALTPLALWGTGRQAPPSRDVWAPSDPKTDRLAPWKTMNRAMTEDPPIGPQAAIIKSFAEIGVGPGQDVTKVDAATQRGLERAAVDGMKLLQATIAGGMGKKVNGWTYPPPAMGRAGLSDQFLLRAAIQTLAGIISNDTAEAIYMNTAVDFSGAKLTGASSYVMRFAPGQAPPVGAFWSVTMYGMDNNFVANPANRYKFGSFPSGDIKPDADGGMTLNIGSTQPAAGARNWLPAPAGEFYLVLRTYLPEGALLTQSWVPPAVTRLP